MPISVGDVLEVTSKGVWQGKPWMNVWQYQVVVTVLGATAEQIGEGWWNHVKATYRALACDLYAGAFSSVVVRSLMSLTGDLGEYPVPPAEQIGTRSVPVEFTQLPRHEAAGVRLSVATRLTRPGQKRIPFLCEIDNNNGALTSSFIPALEAHMDVMSVDMLLGAPVATMALEPVVVSKDLVGLAAVQQEVTGYAINPRVSTQLSRKKP